MGWRAATDLVAVVLKDKMSRLTGTQTYLLARLQPWGSSSHSTRGRQRGDDLTNFRMRAGRGRNQGSFLPGESTGRGHCSLVEPFPLPIFRHRPEPNMRPCPTQLPHHPYYLQCFFHIGVLPQLILLTF